ncbi:hypothetical protein BB561_005113 [Smittium simulii]|uniref:CID domain-containing protein n=1 Tax=Smittium simulii TaxID=133385 RepID=A0A2T9YC68_9FUNG|nr:hypothetical protein BB561_005113 [Smittium simulii]
MDPFETRIAFTDLLAKLGSSSQVIEKISQFAFVNNSLAENLLDCLLEKTDSINISSRLNIIYVINSICDKEAKAKQRVWIEILDPVLSQLIQMIIPKNSEGDANLGFTKKMIDNWKKKAYFEDDTINFIFSLFSDRSYTIPHSESRKADPLRKIEEDRENHKKLKESVWVRKAGEAEIQEFLDLSDTIKEFSVHDWTALREEQIRYINDNYNAQSLV